VGMKYRILIGVRYWILNTRIASIAKIPANNQRFLAGISPLQCDKISSKYVRSGIECFKSNTATVGLTNLYVLTFISQASALVQNSNANIVGSCMSVSM